MKTLRALLAGALAAGTTAAVMSVARPGDATPCLRSVAIDPQVTASEVDRTLSFVVQTASCASAGEVSYVVHAGSAQPGADFQLAAGRLRWTVGDTSPRRITAAVVDDWFPESALEDFTVTLIDPTPQIRVVVGAGQGRIFDNDTPGGLIVVDDDICLATGAALRSATPSPQSTLSPSPSPSLLPGNDICTIEPGHISYIRVVPDGRSSKDEYVHFQTLDGDLKAGLDYVPVRRIVTIPAGSTAVYVQVELLPHAFTQSGRSFFTQLTGYSAGTVSDGLGRVTVWR